MSETVIKVEGVGKKYIIGHTEKRGYKTFRDQIGESFKTVFSKTKKMLSGQTLVEGDEMEEFWALKDVNFEVKQGETLGIIGRNGAGKSTLLKILSRITEPTTGKVILKGRAASLLEVGTGFHPELSGRENIFLNGAILGMSRAEIKRKFDEIVDFSGVEKFLDTPVKRYSSGMYVRLAFAVAAHLEPEILIVDEVLAVGDAEFQKKCLGKMRDVSEREGRTVLFVSHNMNAIQNLCFSCIHMENGRLVEMGETNKVLRLYLKSVTSDFYSAPIDKYSNDVFLKLAKSNAEKMVDSGIMTFHLKIQSKINTKVSIDLKLINELSIPIAFASIGSLDYNELIELTTGENDINLNLSVKDLALGEYHISIDITSPNVKYYDQCIECLNFEVIKMSGKSRQLEQGWNYGYFTLPLIKI